MILRRAIGRAVDTVIVGGLIVALALAAGVDVDEPRPIVSLVALLLFVSYDTVQNARYGQTLGKRLVGLEVVSIDTGRWPVPIAAAVRILSTTPIVLLLGAFSPPALVFFYLTALFNPERRGLHDRFAGTEVQRRTGSRDVSGGRIG